VNLQVENLSGSGIELVLSQALYAIVGAISLEKGGEAANEVVRKKILKPLGIVA
jgi:large subunit ribosomal protein L15